MLRKFFFVATILPMVTISARADDVKIEGVLEDLLQSTQSIEQHVKALDQQSAEASRKLDQILSSLEALRGTLAKQKRSAFYAALGAECDVGYRPKCADIPQQVCQAWGYAHGSVATRDAQAVTGVVCWD